MTTAILIIVSLSSIASITILWMTYKAWKVLVAIAFGLQECDAFSIASYNHLNYANSSIKLLLDDLEDRNASKLQDAIDDENYELAKYYKEMAETIKKLKTMTNEDIENNANS